MVKTRLEEIRQKNMDLATRAAIEWMRGGEKDLLKFRPIAMAIVSYPESIEDRVTGPEAVEVILNQLGITGSDSKQYMEAVASAVKPRPRTEMPGYGCRQSIDRLSEEIEFPPGFRENIFSQADYKVL